MEFRVLGPLEIIGPRGPIKIGSARQRAVLALLILHAGETVTSDRLIDEVWGEDPPPSAHHALEVHVSGLRRALGADRVETEHHGYRLRAEANEVDLERFETMVAEASLAFAEHDARTAAARYTAALALWRGPALADLATGNAARPERARLDELRAMALERRIDADLVCGRHMDVVPDLRRIVAEMPLREAFQARLMLALYRSKRQAEALEVYHQAREVLDRELGVSPGSELEAMQHAVLDHDPALELAGVRAPVEPPATPAAAGVPVERDPELLQAGSALERPQGEVPGQPFDRAGRPTGPARRQHAIRRTVTALMADVSGSTLAGEFLDPESASNPFERCFAEMRAVLERHGGTVETSLGEALIAMFGVRSVHEDDALRAVRAATEMRDALAGLSELFERELGVRITLQVGINTGEVVAGEAAGAVTLMRGDVVKAATRLEQAAGPGEILLEAGTYDLVRWAVEAEPAGAIDPRARSGAIRAFRLLAVAPGLGAHAQRFDSPLVGRARELRQLESAFEQSIADETCQLFTLLGVAGVGKSRLVHEFLRSIRPEAQVVRGRCLPYGERIAFWPVAEAIKQAAGLTDADPADVALDKIGALVRGDPRASAIAAHIGTIIGVSEGPSTSEETSWAIRRFFEAVARGRPLVIVFDDVQWAELSLLDLIESIADSSRGVPILLLCIARPELLDERPGWAGGKLNATSVLLKPLTDAEVSRLAANLLGGSGTPAAVERKVVEATEGNPLFVEEFLAMLVEAGALRRVGEEWIATSELATMATPASIMALLAARLDRLSDDERHVLERAAVVGKVFSREAIEALVEPDALPGLVRQLGALVHKEIIRPDRSAPEGDEAYRFKHILIRDAAYAALPKQQRVVLHERLAD